MGLDIYFFAREKVQAQDARIPAEGDAAAVQERTKVGYFRKVNALVAWFENHAGEVENCVERPVTRAELEVLQRDLDSLTPANCREVFPVTDGFFFGSQDYNEWYWRDVEDVKAWVSRTLETFDFERRTLVLWAWW